MKFRITLKDPDACSDGIKEASLSSLPCGLSDIEREAVSEIRQEALSFFAKKWLLYGKYVTIEFDNADGTATVIPAED